MQRSRTFASLSVATVTLSMLFLASACEISMCDDGPSNLTVESTATCEPTGTPPESRIASAGAERRDDGTLVVTWTSRGLECGTRADDLKIAGDCNWTGWAFTVEIPPTLAVVGVIDLATHADVLGTMTVMHDGSGGTKATINGEPIFVGQIELTQIDEGCVSGVLHTFGTGDPDPVFGGPELNGSFMAPTC